MWHDNINTAWEYVSLDTPQIWEKISRLCCVNSNQDFTRSHNLSKDFYLTSAQCQCTIFLPWCHAIVVSWLLGILIRRIDSIPNSRSRGIKFPLLSAAPRANLRRPTTLSPTKPLFCRAVANPILGCVKQLLDERTTFDHSPFAFPRFNSAW